MCWITTWSSNFQLIKQPFYTRSYAFFCTGMIKLLYCHSLTTHCSAWVSKEGTPFYTFAGALFFPGLYPLHSRLTLSMLQAASSRTSANEKARVEQNNIQTNEWRWYKIRREGYGKRTGVVYKHTSISPLFLCTESAILAVDGRVFIFRTLCCGVLELFKFRIRRHSLTVSTWIPALSVVFPIIFLLFTYFVFLLYFVD